MQFYVWYFMAVASLKIQYESKTGVWARKSPSKVERQSRWASGAKPTDT